jgi:hypothetical protein
MWGFWILLALFLMLLVSIPAYPYSRTWGYTPSGMLLAMLGVWIVLLVFGYVSIWLPWAPPTVVAPPAN